MSDIETTTVSETAASNTAAAPNGAPNNFARTDTKSILREIWAGVKRLRNRLTPTQSSAGTAPAFTLTYTSAPPAYVAGHQFAFIAHAATGGDMTLNVSALGAKKCYDKLGTTQLTTGAFASGAGLVFAYDTALDGGSGGFRWMNQGFETGTGTVTSVAMTVPTGFSVSGSPVTTTGTLAVTLSNQNANIVMAGPSSGSAATPAFRALVAADLPTGLLVARSSTQTGAVATGTTVMPFDDTVPQNTEGDQYMTLAHTPLATTNILEIQVTAVVAASLAMGIGVALFQDSTAGALAGAYEILAAANNIATVTFTHKMVAGTTSATTFKVRAGPSAAGTVTFNGQSGGRIHGGVLASSITIREFKA